VVKNSTNNSWIWITILISTKIKWFVNGETYCPSKKNSSKFVNNFLSYPVGKQTKAKTRLAKVTTADACQYDWSVAGISDGNQLAINGGQLMLCRLNGTQTWGRDGGQTAVRTVAVHKNVPVNFLQ